MIFRPEYLEKLISFKDKELIKVVTGIRRCGKSTLLEIYRRWLLENDIAAQQIQSINFEDYDFYHLRNSNDLHEHILKNCQPDQMNYIFLDEVQHVNDFQRVIDSLYIRKNIDLYITGSNASLLSGELATLLSGRYITIPILPLSFKEYLSAYEEPFELSKKYQDYIVNSSFPYSLRLRDEISQQASGQAAGQIRDYLDGIYNTIVLKDVIERKKISDVSMLERVIRYMFDNIGNITSIKKIADTIISSGRKISVNTIDSYLSALTDSYILYPVGRYDVRTKEFLKIGYKYYLADTGLRFYLLGSRGFDAGRILENVVFLELLRRGGEINIGKLDDKEIDFIVRQGEKCEYYQVALTARDEATYNREMFPLRALKDSYPKYLLTMDDDPASDDNGIRRVNVLDWLLR